MIDLCVKAEFRDNYQKKVIVLYIIGCDIQMLYPINIFKILTFASAAGVDGAACAVAQCVIAADCMLQALVIQYSHRQHSIAVLAAKPDLLIRVVVSWFTISRIVLLILRIPWIGKLPSNPNAIRTYKF